MSGYSILEESSQDGAPVEFHTYTRNATVIGRYNTGPTDLVVAGYTWSSVAGGMQRGDLSSTVEDARNALAVRVARNHPIAVLVHERPRTGTVGVVIQQSHRDDINSLRTIWVGRVLNAKRIQAGVRELRLEPRSVSERRYGCRRVCSVTCQHVLYGEECRLVMDDWDFATTIAGISGRELEVAAVNGALPYTGGIVKWTDGDGISDYAFIELADTTTFTLDLPIWGAAVSDNVVIYPGCDWTMATCDGVFNNKLNYGGRLNVPAKNPVTQSAFL